MERIVTLTLFLTVLAFSTSAMAGPKYRFFDGSGHMDPAVIEALALTSEQTEKIRALHENAKEELIPLKAQVTTKRAQMRLLWTQTTLDPEKIKATQKELQALRNQMRDIRTDMRIAFRTLLTPEQTSKLLAIGFSRDGRSKKGGGYGKGKRSCYGKCQDCGKRGYQCSGCPRN